MDVVDGVEIEIRNGVLGGDPVAFESNLNVNKENEIAESSTDALPGDPPLTAEGLSSSAVGSEGTAAVAPGSQVSTFPKKNGSSKAEKDVGGQNGKAGTRKNPRAGLSQSLSFPTKGSLASALRKNTSAKQMKGDTKNPANGSEFTNGVTSVRQVAAARKSLPVKSGSLDHCAPSEPKSNNDGLKPLKPLNKTMPAKNDDDATSTTSSITPCDGPRRKSTGSGFSFRLEERAEKRKEFFSKLEEKIHAKEQEKTNMQVMSKESQEAEIKQLRKSLTFKATPMPSFYQEPGPPKVELKKIPPTRARSPKLGRHKPSSSAANNSSEGSISSPRANSVNSNGGAATRTGGSVAIKKTTQQSLSKLPSQKAMAAKPEAKPQSSKPKVSIKKKQADKPKAEGTNSKPKPTVEDSVPESSAKMGAVSAEKAIEVTGTMPNSADSGRASSEINEVLTEGSDALNEDTEVSEKD